MPTVKVKDYYAEEHKEQMSKLNRSRQDDLKDLRDSWRSYLAVVMRDYEFQIKQLEDNLADLIATHESMHKASRLVIRTLDKRIEKHQSEKVAQFTYGALAACVVWAIAHYFHVA